MSESKLNKAGLLGTPLSSLQHDSKRSSGNATSAQTLTTPAGKQDNYMGTGGQSDTSELSRTSQANSIESGQLHQNEMDLP